LCPPPPKHSKKPKVSDWDSVEATPAVSRWDATPGAATPAGGVTPAAGDATPGWGDSTPAASRWDATPGRLGEGATPRKNRWDETPQADAVGCLACSLFRAHRRKQ
jgi:splicing factor 3B subunit 1